MKAESEAFFESFVAQFASWTIEDEAIGSPEATLTHTYGAH
jgi:hypothetical protein